MRILYFLIIFLVCFSCQGIANQNTFEHPGFGLSVTKPVSWEFLNPNEARARIVGTELEDRDLNAAVKMFMSTPVVEISKDRKQLPLPKFSITANHIRDNISASAIEIIKLLTVNAPKAFKNYKIVAPPSEIQIADHNAAYMKAHYTGKFFGNDNEYPVKYETWIVPREKYYFMIGAVSAQNDGDNIGDEIESIIKSLKVTEQRSIPKTYLYEILKSHFDEADKFKYSINDYLEMAKPYGIWDIRPRGFSELDLGGDLAQVADVSWYHFGMFNAHLEMSKESFTKPVDKWMQNLNNQRMDFMTKAVNNTTKIGSLAEKVKNSSHDIFISHKKFQRVDGIYKQKGKYWKYDIPKNSYFKISERKINLSGTAFDDKDKEILGLLEELGFYGVIKQNNTAIILIDGFLNYSYGYILTSSNWDLMSLGPLFNLEDLAKLHESPDIYFYFSR